MKRYDWPRWLLLIAFSCIWVSAQPYKIDWQNLNSAGGGKISGGPYSIRGTMGQPVAGKSASADYGLVSGYFGIPLFMPTCNPYPTAQVSGNADICEGDTTPIHVVFTGDPPWNVQWSDGLIDAGILVNPLIRMVSPLDTTIYAVSFIEDANCEGIASGAVLIEIVPFSISVNPLGPTVVQGIDTTILSCQVTCDLGNTQLQWSIPATGFEYPLNQGAITLDPPPPGVTIFRVSVTHPISRETLVENRALLAAVPPVYFDLNGDGCNNEQDLFDLAETWRSAYPTLDDPNGDGALDIRDFLFINLDDFGTPPPCMRVGGL